MALTTPLPEVQGSRIMQGIDLQQATFLIIPGTSDYVTGGYVITAAACRLKNIQYADITGCNTTAQGYTVLPTFPLAQLSEPAGTAGYGFTGYSQFLFYLAVITTGVQVASGFNLTGTIWQITVMGY
jgi:hypothetical protein